MRKPIIAGNWKMNKNIKEALEFVKEVGARAMQDSLTKQGYRLKSNHNY